MTFQARLKIAMRKGNLRVSDLARWFGRRHSTIRGWVIDGREPAGTSFDRAGLESLLDQLMLHVVRFGKKSRVYIKSDD